MRRSCDLSLMLITDAAMCRARGLAETVAAAVAGGATVIQLRDKTIGDDELIALARALRADLAPRRIPLIVNDRPAVAKAAGADGAHIGQDDGDSAAARATLGPDALLGLSVTGPQDLNTVDPKLIDYIGVGPIFASATKADATPPIGLAGLGAIAGGTPVPSVAIGGIDVGNAGLVMKAGARGIAVVSAICAAADPQEAARTLAAEIEGARAA